MSPKASLSNRMVSMDLLLKWNTLSSRRLYFVLTVPSQMITGDQAHVWASLCFLSSADSPLPLLYHSLFLNEGARLAHTHTHRQFTHCRTITHKIFNQMTPCRKSNPHCYSPVVFCCRFSVICCLLCRHAVIHSMSAPSLKIVALNKTKERMRPYHVHHENEDPDIKKIKKVTGWTHDSGVCLLCTPSSSVWDLVQGASMLHAQCVQTVLSGSPQVQSFMRGWLCRRKWKIIVQDYICSPHAESMRKRNQIVFNMVEAETEYVISLKPPGWCRSLV